MFDRNSNIMTKSGVSAEQLDKAMRQIRPDHGLKPALNAIVAAEKKYGINALFIAAHAATETGWGNSVFARTRNNLFGFNAIDSNPGQANKYPSQQASVEHYAAFVSEHYLTKGGKYYNGTTPSGVMTRYASAGDRAADTIANIMNMLSDRIGVPKTPQPDGFPEKKEKPRPKPEPKPETEPIQDIKEPDPQEDITKPDDSDDTKKKTADQPEPPFDTA